MHDPVDIRRRIERLIERVNHRDDYGQLLASGQAVHSPDEVMDVDAWRAEIRRQARADSIKVRTGFNDGLVCAAPRPYPSTHVRDIQRYRDLLAHTVPLAVDLGREPTLTLRDGEEAPCACDRCSARGYGDVVDDVMGGAPFEDECPNETPPKITALTMTYLPARAGHPTGQVVRSECDTRLSVGGPSLPGTPPLVRAARTSGAVGDQAHREVHTATSY